jgi:20S proteasome subunit beta 3
MIGDKCCAIGSDQRFGVQYLTVASNMQKIFKIQDNILMGLSGLATDIQTFSLEIRRKVETYRIKENINLTPKLFINLVASTLYEHRWGPFFVNPIVVGLDEKDNFKPYVATYDSIGYITQSGDFEVAGTSSTMLYGACEAFYKKNLNSVELFETCSQCLLAGIERDCMSGWGAVVYVLTPGKIEAKRLKCRQD